METILDILQEQFPGITMKHLSEACAIIRSQAAPVRRTTAMTNKDHRSNRASVQCDCCKELVNRVDEHGLCFKCEIAQTFASTIEERTDLSDDDAVDLAGDLADYVVSRILDLGMDVAPPERAAFFEDVARGMTRVAGNH